MTELNLNFEVQLELTEDWIRNSQIGNRIITRIIDGEKVGKYKVPLNDFI